MGLYVNRIKYKGGSPRLGASSGIINNAVKNGYYFYDDDYNPVIDYSREYFTIESLEDGNVISFYRGNSATSGLTMQYSKDKTNWTSSSSGNISINADANEKVYFKATLSAGQSWATAETTGGNSSFMATKTYNAMGNVMSLYYGDNFVGQTSLADFTSHCLRNLFNTSNSSGSYNTKIINAENLVLPATTIGSSQESIYNRMFWYCSNLVTAPKEIPLTYANNGSFWGMFEGCTSLTSAPLIRATYAKNASFAHMFNNCRSLTSVTCLLTGKENTDSLGGGGNMWLYGISTTGVLYKNPSVSASFWNGFKPSNWTVEDYVE